MQKARRRLRCRRAQILCVQRSGIQRSHEKNGARCAAAEWRVSGGVGPRVHAVLAVWLVCAALIELVSINCTGARAHVARALFFRPAHRIVATGLRGGPGVARDTHAFSQTDSAAPDVRAETSHLPYFRRHSCSRRHLSTSFRHKRLTILSGKVRVHADELGVDRSAREAP